MIIVTATCKLIKGKKAAFSKLASELINETRKEDGCIEYSLYEELNNEDMMCFIEKWKSQESLEAHIESKHFKRIVPLLNELQSEESVVNIYREI